MNMNKYKCNVTLNLLVGVWAQTLKDGQAFGIAVDTDANSDIPTSLICISIHCSPGRLTIHQRTFAPRHQPRGFALHLYLFIFIFRTITSIEIAMAHGVAQR